MADHNKPGLGDNYANWPAQLKARMDAIMCWLDGGTETNLPAGSKRWNAGGWLEKWTGAAWQQLDFKKLTINGVELTTISSFIKGLLDDADAAAARATLGAASTNVATSVADGLMSSADKARLSALAGRNRIINGAIRVDQRNNGAVKTYTAGAALAYGVDRFYGYCTGANITGQQIALANGQNRYRFTGAAGNTGVGWGHRIESANVRDLASKTATFQIKLSSSSLTSITWTAYHANTVDTFGTLASPTKTQIATGTFTIGGAEAVYSAQINLPSNAMDGVEIVLTGGALLASQTLTFGDVQLEEGGTATAFEHVNIADDLVRCMRYYWRTYSTRPGVGMAASATNGRILVTFPAKMRATPHTFEQSGVPADYTLLSGNITAVSTAIVVNNAMSDQHADLVYTTTGLTVGAGCVARTVSGSSYFGFSSEL